MPGNHKLTIKPSLSALMPPLTQGCRHIHGRRVRIKAEAWEGTHFSSQSMPSAKTYLIDRPKDNTICDTETSCLGKRKINAGGQLAVSTANRRLGAE